jgi:hypothetical protein
MYQRASVIADAAGRAQHADGFRHLTRIEAQDRKILERLIDRLQRRFFQRGQTRFHRSLGGRGLWSDRTATSLLGQHRASIRVRRGPVDGYAVDSDPRLTNRARPSGTVAGSTRGR